MTMMTLVRKASKATVTPLGWPARRRAGDVVVLLYHRLGRGTSEIDLAPSVFEHQLGTLVATERVLTLDEMLVGDPDGGVVLTFDDGYRDFHDVVMPLLVTYQVPATLYLATGLVANGAGTRSADALTWNQLREAVGTGFVTVGSHTHGHANLSKTDEAGAEDEMRRSKDLIEENLGTICAHFAYPWAVGSGPADRVARRLFRTAALDAWKTNRAGRIDPHRIGRVPILRSDGRFFFRRKVRGQLDTEAWLYRAFGRGPWRA
jgi:peptidoglycan/xylan/chitin deacetylase (PgdA/CDA1 family)